MFKISIKVVYLTYILVIFQPRGVMTPSGPQLKKVDLAQSFTELARLDELLDKPSSFSRLELELDIKLIKKLGSSSARFSIFVKSSARARLDFLFS